MYDRSQFFLDIPEGERNDTIKREIVNLPEGWQEYPSFYGHMFFEHSSGMSVYIKKRHGRFEVETANCDTTEVSRKHNTADRTTAVKTAIRFMREVSAGRRDP